jgi:hypothetical protein
LPEDEKEPEAKPDDKPKSEVQKLKDALEYEFYEVIDDVL